MADWKEALAKMANKVAVAQAPAPAPSDTPTVDELKVLVAKVRKMEDDCELILSNRQLDWLMDLFDHADAARWGRFSANAVKFLRTCESGFYSMADTSMFT